VKEAKGTNGVGRAWQLYKMGGLTPAIASMLGSPNAQQMALIRSISRMERKENTLETPLNQLEAVVFDLETTGFHPYHGDEIIAIGGVAIRGGRFAETEPFYRLINPQRSIPQAIAELTGITDDMAAGGSELLQGLHDFMTYAGKRVLIAHGSGHDKQFLNAALWRTSKINLTHRVVDTMMIAKWLKPHRAEYGLDGLLSDCGIEITTRHHALQDAVMTANLYFSFLETILSRQVTTLGEVYAYLSAN
jgi:DNA polymerase-3 subunit epsilon